MISIDFETRSKVDLKKCGVSVYSRHPSTEVMCLVYHFSDQEGLGLWLPNQDPPEYLLERISSGELVEAHNVSFERQIWYYICHVRYGWTPVKFDQWRCSMSACSRLALPRSLEHAGLALGAPIQKDKEGSKIMQRLCKPRKPSKNDPSEWDESPAKLERLYKYCEHDVRSQVEISKLVEPLSGIELDIWKLDQRINMRGLFVDVPAVRKSLEIIEDCRLRSNKKLEDLTGGKIKTPKQVQAIRAWIEERQGEQIEDLSADRVKTWLSRDELDPDVRKILEIRQEASGSSVAKLKAILDRCDEDGRVRWNLVYHGAATGRWAGSGIQIQNFPRGSLKAFEIDTAHRLIHKASADAIDMLLGPPTEVIKSCLRSFVCAPPGMSLLVCDFASIEARVLAWLAGEDELLQVFGSGGDPYILMASKIYDVPESEVTKGQRQIGKVAILGLGYGMGAKAFREACRVMAGVHVDKAFAKKVVKAYRETNPNIRAFWGSLNKACVLAIQNRETHRVGRLEVRYDNNWLKIRLPSGRDLHYKSPRLLKIRAPWSEGFDASVSWRGGIPDGVTDYLDDLDIDLLDAIPNGWTCSLPKSSVDKLLHGNFSANLVCKMKPKEPEYINQIEHWGVDSITRSWTRIRTYGGKLVENVTQAVARDFLAEAMLRVEKKGFPIVATVHDEILCEVPKIKNGLDEFTKLMKMVPTWGQGCPIDVEGYSSERYRK